MNFLSKLVSLRPGSTVEKMIRDVMHGKNEGKDNRDENPNSEENALGGIAGRVGSFIISLLSMIP